MDVDTLNAIFFEEKKITKEGAYRQRISLEGLTEEDLVY